MNKARLEQTTIERPSKQEESHIDLSQFSIVAPELKILPILEGLNRLRRELDLFEIAKKIDRFFVNCRSAVAGR